MADMALYTAVDESVPPALGAAKVVKRSLDATSDEISSELKEALK